VREVPPAGTTPCDPTKDANCKNDAPLYQMPLYKLDVLGTDPNDAQEFNARVGTMSPGNGPFRDEFARSGLADMTKPNLGFGIGNGLQFVTTNTMNWWFQRNQPLMDEWVKAGVFPNAELGRRTMEGFRKNDFRAPLAYPARPMAGYWATAPYLHNHSVLNMDQLLMPASDRSSSFYIGNTEFEPDKLGFESGWFDRGFKFKVSDAGNSNAGHEFSAKQGDPAKPGVIGPLLSEDDRRAIIEYMKVIDDVPNLSPEENARRRNLLKSMEPFFEKQVSPEYKKELAPTYAPTPEANQGTAPGATPGASPAPTGTPPLTTPVASASYTGASTKVFPGLLFLIAAFLVYRRVRP
jgi:hypothetical protein